MTLMLGLFYPNTRSWHVLSPEVIKGVPDPAKFESHTQLARAAEDAGFDYLFLAESWGPLGPRTRSSGYQDPMLLSPILAAHLLSVTQRMSCITTIHTLFFHPVAIARIGSTLDTLSNGRWGINVVAGTGYADSLADSVTGPLTSEQRYERAAECMEILLQAWSQDRIEFSGKYFTLSGQMIGPRTVQQPKPLIVSAGASKPGRAFAGRYADYVFMPGRTPAPELKSRFGDIGDIAESHGRRRSGIKLQMHASILVRPTHKEAEEVSRWIYDTVDLEMVAEYLRGVRATISTYDDIYASMGELQMREIGAVAGSRKIHGGPDEVANEIEKLHREFGADGLALTFPLSAPKEIKYFADLVLPRLADRGMWSWTRPTVAAGAW